MTLTAPQSPTKPPPIDLLKLLEFWPKQLEAMRALRNHRYLLYGGAGGGGKSRFLRWALIALLIEWWGRFDLHNVRVGLFSEDYPTLKDRQVSKLVREVPDWLGVVREDGREGLGLYLNHRYGGGAILLRNLDDPQKYRSAEFAAIAVEELTMNEESIFDDLRFRLRWPGIERPRFLAATNPGGIGHAWVKRLWINRDFPDHLKPVAEEFVFVPAKASDNPSLPASYLESLRTLNPVLRAAVLDGNWDLFSGQMFGQFRRELHVVQPFEIPSWWRRWGSNDPGFSDPGTWYWHACDQDGNVYVYREATFEGVRYSDQAREVKRLSGGEVIPFWTTGMDAFVKDPEDGKSIVDAYKQGGLHNFREPDHGAGCRARMAGVFHELLGNTPIRKPDGTATAELAPVKLKIMASCTRLIETLPSLPQDDNDKEAVAECAVDHWYQGCGYGLQAWHASHSRKPDEEFPEGSYGKVLKMKEKLFPKPKRPDPFRQE